MEFEEVKRIVKIIDDYSVGALIKVEKIVDDVDDFGVFAVFNDLIASGKLVEVYKFYCKECDRNSTETFEVVPEIGTCEKCGAEIKGIMKNIKVFYKKVK